ncbi:unnamed protein product [Arctogadus glacialis]
MEGFLAEEQAGLTESHHSNIKSAVTAPEAPPWPRAVETRRRLPTDPPRTSQRAKENSEKTPAMCLTPGIHGEEA